LRYSAKKGNGNVPTDKEQNMIKHNSANFTRSMVVAIDAVTANHQSINTMGIHVGSNSQSSQSGPQDTTPPSISNNPPICLRLIGLHNRTEEYDKVESKKKKENGI
jgi:hypothetical protein